MVSRLRPIDRVGAKKNKGPLIPLDSGGAVRQEMQEKLDVMQAKLDKLMKWKEEAMMLQAEQAVLKEIADRAQV
jgi:hypothetical protein